MNFIDTVIMGVVEGITEFLPISSTGHLIIAGQLLGQTGDVEKVFEIFIQLGAILAVVVLYHQRFWMLLKKDPEHQFSGLTGLQLLIITSIPAGILGFLLEHRIKEYLFNTTTVTWALGLGGLAIILIERSKFKSVTTSLDNLTKRQALTIGFFQCFALWPGMSRSASTIIGGLFSGLDRKLAAEYSFIAAVPIMIMATFYELYKSWSILNASDITFFAIGFIVAFISAIFAIKFFIRLLQHWSLSPFGFYRIAIALLFLWIVH